MWCKFCFLGVIIEEAANIYCDYIFENKIYVQIYRDLTSTSKSKIIFIFAFDMKFWK